MVKKLFTEIKMEEDDLQGKMTEELQLSNLIFTLKWTQNHPLALYKLHIEKDGKTRNLIETIIPDSDGEISVGLGNFKKNETIKISFGVFPLTDIPKAAVFLIQDKSIVRKTNPPDEKEFKQMKMHEKWEDSTKIKFGGEQ